MATPVLWKDVVGFEGYYQISNLGNVKSLPRERNSKNGSISFAECNKLL